MVRTCQGPPAEEAVSFALALTEEFARLLHDSGHRDMATLLDAIGDLGELTQKRMARGGDAGLIGPGSETLDYVLDQMDALAELMSRHGVHDAALLFRTPGQLRLAAEARRIAATTMAA